VRSVAAKTLYPGRHVATDEVLAVVATFIAGFGMSPQLPTASGGNVMNTIVASVVMRPDDDIEVDVKIRQGFEDVQWAVNLRRLDKNFAIGD